MGKKVWIATDQSSITVGMRLGMVGLKSRLENRLGNENVGFYHYLHEADRKLSADDIIAFSLSNPLEHHHIFACLNKLRIPALRTERNSAMPLVIGGGLGFINPEVLADFFDFQVLGLKYDPFEEILSRLVMLDSTIDRREVYLLGIGIPNVYIPALIDVHIDGSTNEIRELSPRYELVFDHGSDVPPIGAMTGEDEAVLMPDLGCRHKCSFCELTYFFRHVEHSLEDVKAEVDRLAAAGAKKIKINSATAAQYSGIRELLTHIQAKGITAGFGSMRVDEMNPDFLQLAAPVMGYTKTNYIYKRKKPASGKALHFGVEFGTDRMYRLMRKGLTEKEVYKRLSTLRQFGIDNIGMYFIVGAPTERREDLDGIANIIAFAAENSAQVYVNLNPLISSPGTPLQRSENISVAEFENILEFIKSSVKNSIGAEKFQQSVNFEHLNAGLYIYETITMRADRRISKFIQHFYNSGCSYEALTPKIANRLLTECNLPTEEFFRRRIELHNPLPWQLAISKALHAAERSYLIREDAERLGNQRREANVVGF